MSNNQITVFPAVDADTPLWHVDISHNQIEDLTGLAGNLSVNFINAKKMFFDILPEDAFALVNIDDKVGMYMTQNTRAKVYTYSLRAEADFRCKILETRLDGTLLDLDNNEIEVGFTGRFNAYNLTAVYGAAILFNSQ